MSPLQQSAAKYTQWTTYLYVLEPNASSTPPPLHHVFFGASLSLDNLPGLPYQLEALFVLLVSIMTVTFFIDFFISPPSVSEVAEGFSFEADSQATLPALGLIGAVIMPHNIYLHSALVLSRFVDRSNTKKLWEVN